MAQSEIIVLIRILLGWLGVYLASAGVPPELVHLITRDPATAEALVSVGGMVAGSILAGAQILWWRLAKRFGWQT